MFSLCLSGTGARRHVKAPLAVVLVLWCGAMADSRAAEPASRPVFRIDVPNPTQDKPQSKLWFARGHWWAWLPTGTGSSVWKRTTSGWQHQEYLDNDLRGLPGQADVWADESGACAVLVDKQRMAVIRLEWDSRNGRYARVAAPAQFTMSPADRQDTLETATIARDGRGRWWIAYAWQRSIWVRASLGGGIEEWTKPLQISRHAIDDDDICAIVALPGAVGVIWSDQAQDTVYFRRRDDNAGTGSWQDAEVASQGGGTADDHINAAIGADGTLFVATKNSVDRIGHAQLVLRVRSPGGEWINHPYATRTRAEEPTRPIALLGGSPARLFLLHTTYGRDPVTPENWISWQATDPHKIDLSEKAQPLIRTSGRINNVTGSKSRLPAGQVWLVLASDQDGNVYEADLSGR